MHIDRSTWYSKSDFAILFTGCCIDANVSSSCLPVCHLSSMPTDLNVLTACASDINKVLKCGTGVYNIYQLHIHVCIQRSVVYRHTALAVLALQLVCLIHVCRHLSNHQLDHMIGPSHQPKATPISWSSTCICKGP